MGQFLPFTKQVLKNLFSEPATTQYPFVPREYPERTRGHVDINKDQCILCGMCMRSCLQGQSQLTEQERLGLSTALTAYSVATV